MSNILKLDLTNQQRADLKLEFDKLETIDEKLDFWNEKLKIDFCYFDQCEMNDIQDFWIKLTNEDEFEYINLRNLRTFKEKLQLFNGKNNFPDLKEREQKFLTKIEKVPNKESFINEELRVIERLVNQKETESIQFPFSKSGFFVATYKQYVESGIVQIWNKNINEVGNLLESDRGLTIAKYKEFLEDYRSPKRPDQTKPYSHVVQILILDYLGFYKNLSNIKRAKIYSPIINRNIEATRQLFSEINDNETSKNIKNLDLILSYFIELGFEEQIQLVKIDIVKAKKKKK